MTTNKTKKLTLSTLNKEDAALNGLKEIYILDGKYGVTINKTFRTTLIKKLIIDYLKLIDELKNRPEVTTDTLINIPVLLYGLTCKYFSDLPISFKNIDELAETTKKLMDLGIIDQLYSGEDNGFDQVEIEKLNKEIILASKNVGQAIGEMAIQDALNEAKSDEEEKNGE
jgi:hypothetical protein